MNPLERLAGTVDFEMFRETLEAGMYHERVTNAGGKAIQLCADVQDPRSATDVQFERRADRIPD